MDSRDLEEKIMGLKTLKDDNNISEDEQEELIKLLKLKEETENYGWLNGIYFIPDYEFEDYCRELAEDNYISNNDKNPLLNYIDWRGWARDCKMDYMEVEYCGTTYFYREA